MSKSRRFGVTLIVIIGAIIALLIVARIVFRLPDIERIERTDIELGAQPSELASALEDQAGKRRGLTLVSPLVDGREAFLARLSVIKNARRSLDAQYYIWQDDITGRILLGEMLSAAKRGVRVRLLVDDNGIPGLDPALTQLDREATAQVRLYNPFVLRKPKALGYAFDFSRLNRRMHNKAMIADGAMAIVGGRNIGDVYFSYGDGAHFFDLDALVAGKAATDAQDNFEEFWDSGSSYPIRSIVGEENGAPSIIDASAADARKRARAASYLDEAESQNAASMLRGRFDRGKWVEATLVSDLPTKTRGAGKSNDVMANAVLSAIGDTKTKADIVSAYFVPGERGMETLSQVRNRGAQVRILTNSLATNDVAPVYGAYRTYRDRMLQAGITLFELKPNSDQSTRINWKHQFRSTSSLHGKTFALDGRKVFIGSFNLDPRSARINTEMGIFFDHPELAMMLAASLDRSPMNWQLKLDQSGQTQWLDGGEVIAVANEPQTDWMQRILADVAYYLPIEKLL